MPSISPALGALAFELVDFLDDINGNDDVVVFEFEDGLRVVQKDVGVEDVVLLHVNRVIRRDFRSACGRVAPSSVPGGRARFHSEGVDSGLMWPSRTPPAVFRARRERLWHSLGEVSALLAAGRPRVKNYPANTHPFRADSHFLYLTGRSIPEAALLLAEPEPKLYVPPPDSAAALWDGPTPSMEELGRELGIRVRPISELGEWLRISGEDVATVPPNDDETAAWLSDALPRRVEARR